jgi:hypothetical protein
MAVTLELNRVVVVEIVESKDRMAVVQQTTGQVEADEAGGTGDEEVGHERKAEREGSNKVQTRLTALVQRRFKKVQSRLTALVQ